MSEKKEQESVDQLLNSLVFQVKLEDIPFERIRKSESVQIHLKQLVSRAYLDRNYTRAQTKCAFDQVVCCIITELLKTEPSEQKEASVEKETSTDSVDELSADLESGKKRPAILPQPVECPSEVVDQIEKQLNYFKKQRLSAEELFGDSSSDSDDSEVEILKQAAGETATEERLSLPEVIEIE